MANRNIQFRRNNTIAANAQAAIAKISKHLDEYYDGEQIFARYYTYFKGEFALNANKEKQPFTAQGLTEDAYLGVYVDNTKYTITQNSVKYHILNANGEYLNGDSNWDKYQSTAATMVGLVYCNDKTGTDRVINITYSDSNGIDELINSGISAADEKSVKNVGVNQLTATTYDNTNADNYEVVTTTKGGTTAQTDTFQLRFTPYSPSGLTVPTTIGDIEKGTKVSDLNGETISKVLDDILFPTKYPILTNPSKNLVFVDTNNTTAKLVKVGTPYYSLKGTYTKGKSIINDGVSAAKFYTGNYVSATFTANFTGGTAANTSVDPTLMQNFTAPTFTVTSGNSTVNTTATNTNPIGYESAYATATTNSKMDKIGTYKFTCDIQYGQGDTLITSKSNPASNPIRYESLDGVANTDQAPYATVTNPNTNGTVNVSEICEVNTTLPVFATTANTTTYTELPLVKWGASGDEFSNDSTNAWRLQFPDTTAANAIKIKTPRELKSIKAYNPTTQNFDIDFSNMFTRTTSDETITVSGVETTYSYYIYTWSGAAASTPYIKITWK